MNKTCWIRLHILPWKYPKKVGTRLFVLFTTKLVLKNGVILWSLNCTMLYAYGTCNLSQGADLETTAVYYFYNINGKENKTATTWVKTFNVRWFGPGCVGSEKIFSSRLSTAVKMCGSGWIHCKQVHFSRQTYFLLLHSSIASTGSSETRVNLF